MFKKNISISALFVALLLSSVAQAQTCATPPSCASLGYTLTAPKDEGWVCTGCPFDPTKFACTAKPCPTYTVLEGKLGVCPDLDKWETDNFACLGGFSGGKPCYYCPKKILVTNIYSANTPPPFEHTQKQLLCAYYKK